MRKTFKYLIPVLVPMLLSCGRSGVYGGASGSNASTTVGDTTFSGPGATGSSTSSVVTPLSWVRVHSGNAFSFAGPTLEKLPYDTIENDLAGEFDVANNSFSPKKAGIFEISVHASLGSPSGGWGVNEFCKILILKNGNGVHEASSLVSSTANGCEPETTTSIQLAAGDKVTIVMQHTHPTAVGLVPDASYTNLSIVQLRAL